MLKTYRITREREVNVESAGGASGWGTGNVVLTVFARRDAVITAVTQS